MSILLSPKVAGQPDLVGWLRGKVSDAEKALKTREDMAALWRTGTNAEWAAAGAMHPSTAGRTLRKAARLKEADMHGRIAAKLRHEVTMFRAALAALSPPAQMTQQPEVLECRNKLGET